MADIELILIPSGGEEWLVFPQSIVGRVYPYAPALSAEKASEFVIGSMLVQNEKMPVLDFVFTPKKIPYEEMYRIILVSTITDKSSYRRYAVISYGEPLLIKVNEKEISKLSNSNHHFITQYVSIANQSDKKIALLDLPLFEAELRMR